MENISLVLFRLGFLEVTVVDIIDIVIVSYVLYRLYSVMRGTIAAQIFIGLILIVAVSFISQTLDMKLLSWILRTVGDVWVVALIIIFQPELRRILLLLGRRGLVSSLERHDVNRAIDELVSAAEEVSLRRFGMLVVVTLRTDIAFSVDTGVPIDAKLTKEMLVSIFNPKAPLHDGAVVVAGEEIRWARVILPHSSTTHYNGILLGTRHRAGLGISEISDVFVIIVSEENSNISYAREGKLYYNQSVDSLRLALIEALGVADNRRERLSFRSLLRGPSKRRTRHARSRGASTGEQ